MKYILICLFLVGCSNVSFNKDINPEPKQSKQYGKLVDPATKQTKKYDLKLERELSGKDYSAEVKPSADLPNPNLILERGLVYTPTTRIRQRIISGGTNLPQFRAVPESEYWRGN